jgi:hypothetical protein
LALLKRTGVKSLYAAERLTQTNDWY